MGEGREGGEQDSGVWDEQKEGGGKETQEKSVSRDVSDTQWRLK